MKSKLVKKKSVYSIRQRAKIISYKKLIKTNNKKAKHSSTEETEQNAGKLAHSAINRCVKSFFYVPNLLLTQGRRDTQ